MVAMEKLGFERALEDLLHEWPGDKHRSDRQAHGDLEAPQRRNYPEIDHQFRCMAHL